MTSGEKTRSAVDSTTIVEFAQLVARRIGETLERQYGAESGGDVGARIALDALVEFLQSRNGKSQEALATEGRCPPKPDIIAALVSEGRCPPKEEILESLATEGRCPPKADILEALATEGRCPPKPDIIAALVSEGRCPPTTEFEEVGRVISVQRIDPPSGS